MAGEPRNLIPADEALEASPVAFNYTDIRAMAAGLLRKTKGTCDKMLEGARSQVAALEKQAQEEGRAKGHAEGLAKGEAEGLKKGEAAGEKRVAAAVEEERVTFRGHLAPAAESLSGFMAELEGWRGRLIASAEADLLRLAMDIARRIVNAELAVRPEGAADILREAVGLVTHRTDMDVYGHPEDLAILEAEVPALRAAFPDTGAVRFLPGPEVERGGVVVRTRELEVDLRLATRLAAFEQALLGVSGEAAAAPWSRNIPDEPDIPETAQTPPEPPTEGNAPTDADDAAAPDIAMPEAN